MYHQKLYDKNVLILASPEGHKDWAWWGENFVNFQRWVKDFEAPKQAQVTMKNVSWTKNTKSKQWKLLAKTMGSKL